VVVGGLLAVAGGLSLLTFLYWRRTRPVPYNAALDALGDLAGPAPLAPGGSGVAGEPTVMAPTVTAPVPSRTPDQAAALLAALVAAEEAKGRVSDREPAPVPEGSADVAGPAATGEGPGAVAAPAAPEVAPIEPGGPGFRVMGAVAAAAAAADAAGGDAAGGDGPGGDGATAGTTDPPSDEASASDAARGDGLAPGPAVGVAPLEFVTREDLESASAAAEPAAPIDPLAQLLAETDTGTPPPGSPGPAGP
jgi:hypothetical protein